MNKRNFVPNEEEKEFIEELKLRLKPINELKLDFHIYFIKDKGEKIAWAEKICGYTEDGPVTTFGDSYSLRKVQNRFIFKTIEHKE